MAVLLGVGLIAVAAGCQRETVRGTGGQEMTVTIPRSVTIQRGQTKVVDVGIQRKAFTEGVGVAVSQLPKGVEAEVPSKPVETDKATVLLKASKFADLVGNQAVSVTVSGPSGMQAIQYFKLTVTE